MDFDEIEKIYEKVIIKFNKSSIFKLGDIMKNNPIAKFFYAKYYLMGYDTDIFPCGSTELIYESYRDGFKYAINGFYAVLKNRKYTKNELNHIRKSLQKFKDEYSYVLLGIYYLSLNQIKKAINSFELSGNNDALLELALIYYKNKNYKNLSKSVEILKKLIKNKDYRAHNVLGDIYLDKKELIYAVENYEEAYKCKDEVNVAYANYKIGMIYYNFLSNNGVYDYINLFGHLEKSVTKHFDKASSILGIEYFNFYLNVNKEYWPTIKDYEKKAFKYLTLAIEHDLIEDPRVFLYLSICYKKGIGTKENYKLSRLYYDEYKLAQINIIKKNEQDRFYNCTYEV